MKSFYYSEAHNYSKSDMKAPLSHTMAVPYLHTRATICTEKCVLYWLWEST